MISFLTKDPIFRMIEVLASAGYKFPTYIPQTGVHADDGSVEGAYDRTLSQFRENKQHICRSLVRSISPGL